MIDINSIRNAIFTISDPIADMDKTKAKNKKRNWGTYTLGQDCVISTAGSDVKTHSFIKEGASIQKKVKDPIQDALMYVILKY